MKQYWAARRMQTQEPLAIKTVLVPDSEVSAVRYFLKYHSQKYCSPAPCR